MSPAAPLLNVPPMLTALRALYVLAAAGAAAVFVSGGFEEKLPGFVVRHPFLTWVLATAALSLAVVADLAVRRKRIENIAAVYFGVLIGALLSYLLMQALHPAVADTGLEGAVETGATLAMCYVSVSFLLQTKGEFRFLIPYVEFSRDLKGGRPLILDASALTDGRIAGLAEAGMADTLLIVPDFVVDAVQATADSPDKNRRERGRRGLDVLQRLRNADGGHLRVEETGESPVGPEVEQRILQIVDEHGGRLLTTDGDLSRAAAARGAECVNLNAVAKALRPKYLPGDTIQLRIQKPGDNPGQGVGYLDDGTMVVCEHAVDCQQEDVTAEVTSLLQSGNGRMIFAKLAA